MIAWQTQEPAIDWTQNNLLRHRSAYLRAKAEFISSNERKPETSADYAAIARRAEAIRKGEL